MARMDGFTQQYFETALWSSSDESDDQGGEPLDKNYSISDFAPETRDKMIADCADFQERFGELIDAGGGDYKRAGHDFWLTRNGHGAGFWDGDWPEPQATELTDASKEYGEFYLYLGDPGEDGERLIYGPPPGAHGVRERGKRAHAPRSTERWTVEPGRTVFFDGQPAFRLDSDDNDVRNVPHVAVDSAAHLIANLFNREGVTVDSLYKRQMGRAHRRAQKASR